MKAAGARAPFYTRAMLVLLGKERFLSYSVAKLTGAKRGTAQQFYKQLKDQREFEAHIRSKLNETGRGRGELPLEAAYCLYVACRLVRPKAVVETGVGPGVSSAFILKALNENSFGTLHSIDMPNYEEVLVKSDPEYADHERSGRKLVIVPPGKEPGYVIPDGLRERWDFHVGLSSEVLPKVLSEIGQIDLFLHDSEHTYKNMMFEYQTAWPSIRDGGLIIGHDTGWNAAFSDFGSQVNRRPLRMIPTSLSGIRR
jgi:predicted O-methyltransferase YrrM